MKEVEVIVSFQNFMALKVSSIHELRKTLLKFEKENPYVLTSIREVEGK